MTALPPTTTKSPQRKQGKGIPCSRCGLVHALSRWALLALIAGYLLFAHLGCHGDEDNELFAVIQSAGQTLAGPDDPQR